MSIELNGLHEPAEAPALVKSLASAGFDESVVDLWICFDVGIDPPEAIDSFLTARSKAYDRLLVSLRRLPGSNSSTPLA